MRTLRVPMRLTVEVLEDRVAMAGEAVVIPAGTGSEEAWIYRNPTLLTNAFGTAVESTQDPYVLDQKYGFSVQTSSLWTGKTTTSTGRA